MSEMVLDIARSLGLPAWKVENAIELLEDGKTIPFIARYRKEKTGELNEIQLRDIADTLEYMKKLQARKEEVLRLIEEKGKLTDELKTRIVEAGTLQVVEDLYLPYKSRKKTRADKAREKQLQPLADFLKTARKRDDDFIIGFVNAELEVSTVEGALEGARDILAEEFAQDIMIRERVRNELKTKGIIKSEKTDSEDERAVYRDYYDFSQPINRLAAHRVLALFRGEREEILKVHLELPFDILPSLKRLAGWTDSLAYYSELEEAAIDSFSRLLFPSIEREVRTQIREEAETRAIHVFARNLRDLFLQPPLGEKVVMGIDPGYRTGCKLAVIGRDGALLYHDVIFPTPPQNDYTGSAMKVVQATNLLGVELISIGNGTGSRETEQFVSRLIKEHRLAIKYMITTESGASVYSASKVAIEEFPDQDVTTRGAISIARRVQDPLAEYVKIPPEAIGVGMYQHDVNQSELKKALDREVESIVNMVGVNLNTASEHLLKYISGLGPKIAASIVKYRSENGPFRNRKDLMKVTGLGPKAFEQAAGFCRIINGDEPLDGTTVHPESYAIARELLDKIGVSSEKLFEKRLELPERLARIDVEEFSKEKNFNPITVREVIGMLKKPGLDPREELPQPLLRTDVLTMEDLASGMELEGTVRNVVDFGAFVDIGVKQDGLIHKSRMGNRVRDPLEVLSVGQIVKVKIIEVDLQRMRIGLELLA
ncbi:MAG: RNA-binding transcriptional accessory protein [Mesotoga sp.]|nr:RNA-binding transcriptional accessory protein [Mesotoga sp.]NLI07638.1 RNA-binding transcriptional accessory protein [Thermotogaceae bacterium]HON27155.1 Tex family protein [Mesotoga infera]